jgi:macrodomain Ter protein organizer (MatP/YcbG family)
MTLPLHRLRRHTRGMSLTTIKLSAATRDRLKVHAARRGESLGAHIERLLDLADREARFEALRTAIAATPPTALAAYEREAAEWLDADLS